MSITNSVYEGGSAREEVFDKTQKAHQRSKTIAYFNRKLWNALSLLAGDLIALMASILAAGLFRWWFYGEPMVKDLILLLVLAWSVGAGIAKLLPSWGLGAVEELRRIVILILSIYGAVTIVLFILKRSEEISRLVMTLSLLISAVLVPLTRMLVKEILVRFGLWGIQTVIYGGVETSRRVFKTLSRNKGFGYLPVGVFHYNGEERHKEMKGIPVFRRSGKHLAKAPVAILAIPEHGREKIVEMLDGHLSVYRHVIIIPNLFEVQSLWVQTRDLGGILGLEITRNLLSPLSSFTKLIAGYAFVFLSSIFWLPLCALIAFFIWLEDKNNPLFFQERVGKNGKVFKAWKFRTMFPESEKILQAKLDESEGLKAEWNKNFKLKDDPRITKIGKVLRRTSLDELPQMVNIILGEMSLVGPRPLPKYHFDSLDEKTKSLRKNVRPGITGLWQVSGRSDTGLTGMRKWDAYYVRNWSIWLDIIVLVRTIKAVIKGSGAY